jgi:hypothetical protein
MGIKQVLGATLPVATCLRGKASWRKTQKNRPFSLLLNFSVSDLESNEWPVFPRLSGPICARATFGIS